MSEIITERNKFKKLFSNTTSRILLGVWIIARGSRFSMKSIAELISFPEDALEAKLQTFAGMGLVHVTSGGDGERQVEFLPPPTPEIEKIILELFDGRKSDFESVELKMRSLIYKNLLSLPL
ncbi:MAG TPA: hypothetical protein VK859_06325 [bacterium]|jgi:hypothetical protein|nr:hypothetical protein [bacterium]